MKSAKVTVQEVLGQYVVFEFTGEITILPEGLNANVIKTMLESYSREVAVHYFHAQLKKIYGWSMLPSVSPEAYEAFDKWISEQKER